LSAPVLLYLFPAVYPDPHKKKRETAEEAAIQSFTLWQAEIRNTQGLPQEKKARSGAVRPRKRSLFSPAPPAPLYAGHKNQRIAAE
jgi:hypothetical protein